MRMLSARAFITAGAIYSLDGGVTIQGDTAFTGNTANASGGKMLYMDGHPLTDSHGHGRGDH